MKIEINGQNEASWLTGVRKFLKEVHKTDNLMDNKNDERTCSMHVLDKIAVVFQNLWENESSNLIFSFFLNGF